MPHMSTANPILTVAELWNATPLRLRQVWGGINGVLFHQMLHGPKAALSRRRLAERHVVDANWLETSPKPLKLSARHPGTLHRDVRLRRPCRRGRRRLRSSFAG